MIKYLLNLHKGTPLEKPVQRIAKAISRSRAIKRYKRDGEPQGKLTKSEDIPRPRRN